METTTCKLCSESFGTELERFEHELSLSHHFKLEEKTKNSKHRCELCGEDFSNLLMFSEHINLETHQRKVAEKRRNNPSSSTINPSTTTSDSNYYHNRPGLSGILSRSFSALKETARIRATLTEPLTLPSNSAPKRRKGNNRSLEEPQRSTPPQEVPKHLDNFPEGPKKSTEPQGKDGPSIYMTPQNEKVIQQSQGPHRGTPTSHGGSRPHHPYVRPHPHYSDPRPLPQTKYPDPRLSSKRVSFRHPPEDFIPQSSYVVSSEEQSNPPLPKTHSYSRLPDSTLSLLKTHSYSRPPDSTPLSHGNKQPITRRPIRHQSSTLEQGHLPTKAKEKFVHDTQSNKIEGLEKQGKKESWNAVDMNLEKNKAEQNIERKESRSGTSDRNQATSSLSEVGSQWASKAYTPSSQSRREMANQRGSALTEHQKTKNRFQRPVIKGEAQLVPPSRYDLKALQDNKKNAGSTKISNPVLTSKGPPSDPGKPTISSSPQLTFSSKPVVLMAGPLGMVDMSSYSAHLSSIAALKAGQANAKEKVAGSSSSLKEKVSASSSSSPVGQDARSSRPEQTTQTGHAVIKTTLTQISGTKNEPSKLLIADKGSTSLSVSSPKSKTPTEKPEAIGPKKSDTDEPISSSISNKTPFNEQPSEAAAHMPTQKSNQSVSSRPEPTATLYLDCVTSKRPSLKDEHTELKSSALTAPQKIERKGRALEPQEDKQSKEIITGCLKPNSPAKTRQNMETQVSKVHLFSNIDSSSIKPVEEFGGDVSQQKGGSTAKREKQGPSPEVDGIVISLDEEPSSDSGCKTLQKRSDVSTPVSSTLSNQPTTSCSSFISTSTLSNQQTTSCSSSISTSTLSNQQTTSCSSFVSTSIASTPTSVSQIINSVMSTNIQTLISNKELTPVISSESPETQEEEGADSFSCARVRNYLKRKLEDNGKLTTEPKRFKQSLNVKPTKSLPKSSTSVSKSKKETLHLLVKKRVEEGVVTTPSTFKTKTDCKRKEVAVSPSRKRQRKCLLPKKNPASPVTQPKSKKKEEERFSLLPVEGEKVDSHAWQSSSENKGLGSSMDGVITMETKNQTTSVDSKAPGEVNTTDEIIKKVFGPSSASLRPSVTMSADNSCHFKHQNGARCSNKVNKGDRLCPTHKLVPEQLKMRLGLSPTKSSGKTVHTGSRLVSTLAEIKSEPVKFGELGPGHLDHTPLVKDPSHPVISMVKSEPMDMEDHGVQNQFGPTPLSPEPSYPPPNDSFHQNTPEASMLIKAENIIASSDFNNTMESNIRSDKPLPSGKIPSAPSPPEPVKVSEKTPDPIGMSSSEPPPPPPSSPPILSDQSNDSVGPLATSEDLLQLVVPPSSLPLAGVDAKETLSNSSALSPNPPHPPCPDHANLNDLTKSPPIDRADLNPPQSPEEPMETSSQAGGGVPPLPDIEFVGVTSQPRESVSLSPDIKSITPASLKIELAELNRREEEVQIALVETESELSQVSRKVEEFQKKLSLLTASKEQLVEKCNELTRQYQEVLSLKQNLLFSKYVSKYIPQLTKKTESPVSSTSCKSLAAIPSSKQQSDSPSPQIHSCSESPQPPCLDAMRSTDVDDRQYIGLSDRNKDLTKSDPCSSISASELVPETFSSSSGTKKHSLKAESIESKKFKTEPEDDFNNGNETDRLGTEGVLSNQAIPNSESKNKSFRNRNESMSTEARSFASLHSQSDEVFFQPQQEEMRADQSLECTRVIPEFKPFSNSVLSMKIHGQTLFACSSDKTTRAYDVKTGKMLKQFSNHQKAVTCLELYHGEEATFLLSSSSDKLIHMYNIESGKIVAKFKCITRVMYLGVFDSLLYIAQHSGSIAIIDLQSKQLIGKQRCHSAERAISSITVTSSMLFTAAFDHTVVCWDIKELNQSHQMKDKLNIVKKISTFNNTVLCMAIHDYSLLCGSADKSVQVFDTHTWERTHCLKCHNGAVTALEIMGKVLVTTCFDKMIRCFDLERFELLQVYAGHSDMIFSLATSNGIIYTGSRDGSLKGICLDLTVYYECKWPNCKLRFGMFQHLEQHIKVHCPDNEGPSKCLWETCGTPDSFTDLLQHVQNTHLANESDFRL